MLGALGNIPAQYRWIMVAALPMVLAAAYWYFLYSPVAQEIANLDQQIEQQHQILSDYQKVAADYDSFQTLVYDLEIKLRKALSQLPDSKEIPDLIRQVSDIGVRSGLEITLLRPQPEQLHEYYAEVPVTLKMIGAYHSLGQFFDQLAQLPRIISVSKVKFDGHTQENVTRIEAECLATTYRFLDGSEVGVAPEEEKQRRRKR
jgi:type IV pilus assembly protein PilO